MLHMYVCLLVYKSLYLQTYKYNVSSLLLTIIIFNMLGNCVVMADVIATAASSDSLARDDRINTKLYSFDL